MLLLYIKRMTIPRLELNGALILAQLLSHCKELLGLPLSHVFAWTDSTIVLPWLQGNPRRFKVYVGNRVAQIMELVLTRCWSHVVSEDNPADCASRGIFPSELLNNDLWWSGPSWLKLLPSKWPRNNLPADVTHEEAEELNMTTTCTLAVIEDPLIPVDKFSSFNLYKRVTAWTIRFIHNCKSRVQATQPKSGPLTTDELNLATNYWYSIIQRTHHYWYSIIQRTHLPGELRILTMKSQKIPMSSKVYSLNPFVDDQGMLRVGGRQQKARFSYNSRHLIILDSRHPLTKLLIRSEHIRLLHGGSLLVSSSLFRNSDIGPFAR